MISLTTARALAATGLVWEPGRGDRFVIPDREMDDEVFVLSDMTIEAHDHASGRVLGFNGTTEWALDSVEADQALWLPGEGALRELLGPALVRLERVAGPPAAWAVTVTATADGVDGADDPAEPLTTTVTDTDAEEAYGLALLAVRARSARDLLPLAAQQLGARVARVGAAGASGWDAVGGAEGLTRREVLAGVVEQHRATRGLLAGDAAEVVAGRLRRQEELDPVAEDPAGTWARAALASLGAWAVADPRAPLATAVRGGGAGALAERQLVDLVVAAWDLAPGPLEAVTTRWALRLARAEEATRSVGTDEGGSDEGGSDGAGTTAVGTGPPRAATVASEAQQLVELTHPR